MKVTIQFSASDFNSWDSIIPVVHEFEKFSDAVSFAQRLVDHFSCNPARLVQIPENLILDESVSFSKYVGGCSGTYIHRSSISF